MRLGAEHPPDDVAALESVETTTDPDSLASQKVVLGNGGVRVETFDKSAACDHVPSRRFRIVLGVTA